MCRESGRVAATLLAAFSVFLQTQGLDVCSRAHELHGVAWPLVARMWQVHVRSASCSL